MFKYTVKILTRESKMKDNGYVPIYLRITIAGRAAFISTGHDVPAIMWDKKKERVKDGFMLSSSINADIVTRKQTIIQRLATVQVEGKAVTAAQAKLLFASADLHNIFEFVTAYIAEMNHKREDGTLENYRKHAQVLEDFHGSKSLTFEEINHDYLVRFEAYLRSREKENGELLGGNYIFAINKTLRSFFNAAIKRGIIDHYPFETFEMPVYVNPTKAYLTIAELTEIEKLADNTRDNTVRETAVYFLLGCYSGLRVSDWMKFNINEHIKNGRLRLRAKKNNEWVTMRILGRLEAHLRRIEQTPLTITVHEINRTLKDIAKVCKIKKLLTTHVGRHTFAITLCAEQGISAETCAELMGVTVATCVENYYRVTNRKIDKETVVWEGL